ncbi:hypothetical protein PMAYCL1PPCAC_24944, partial [Pristionchus mayeri]
TICIYISDGSLLGFIRFEVDNVSTLDESGRFSPEVEVKGVPWKLWIGKEDEFAQVFLYYHESGSNIWSIDVSAEISLINIAKQGNATKVCCFFPLPSFMVTFFRSSRNLSTVMLQNNEGFIKDDKYTIEVRFWVSNMRGTRMASHFDFTDPNEPNHDIALIIDGEKIYANKILAALSPVFYAMFYGDFAEKNKKE